MPKILHTADIHFDTPFSARFDERQARMRRNEIKNTFSEIIRMAAEADILLIAGDLFDSAYVREETLEFVRRKFEEIPKTKIFLAAGNHDPLASGLYQQITCANVHVFSETMTYVDLPELETRVHGMSFADKHETALDDTLPECHPQWCNLLLIHGDAGNGDSLYRPIQRSFLERAGVDYIALGHIHRYSGLQRAGHSVYAYAGVPEGRGFDECGECGVIAGETARGVVNLRFIPTAGRHYFIQEVDVQPEMDVHAVAAAIAEQTLSVGHFEDFYRVILKGKRREGLWNTALWTAEILDLVLRIDKRLSYLELEDRTEMAVDDALIKRNPLVQEFIREFEDPPAGEEAVYAMAKEIGLQAMMERNDD